MHSATTPQPTPQTLVDLSEAVGTDGVAQLIGLFIDEAPKSRRALQEAIEHRSPDELRRAAHSLKSASGYLGMDELSELAQTIEQLVLEGQDQKALMAAQALPGLLDSTVAILQSHLNQIVAH